MKKKQNKCCWKEKPQETLNQSIKIPKEDWTDSFAGKWQDDRTTEEVIDDIHAARNANI